MSASVAALPFGKHKGVPLDQVPGDYLRWFVANVENLYPKTRTMIENELKRRAGSPAQELRPRPQPAPRPAATPSEPAATCARCGLAGTPERPLVHETCFVERDDNAAPF